MRTNVKHLYSICIKQGERRHEMGDAQVEEVCVCVCVCVCVEGEGPERLLRPLRSPCLLAPVLSPH